MSKVYFTDDLANKMKLRITSDEWSSFKSFIDDITDQPDYETIRIMFYHVFTENFFQFTMKNKALALDYGTQDDERLKADVNRDSMFWKEIRQEVEVLEKCDLVELSQLNVIREESIKPFGQMFPDENLIAEAIADFEMLKSAIQEPVNVSSSKMSRKEVSIACRDFLKTSGIGVKPREIVIEEIEWTSDCEQSVSSQAVQQKSKKRAKKRKSRAKASSNSSDSESDGEFKRMTRSLGFRTQNVMKGIGVASNDSEKLKKCYDKAE